MQLLLSSEKTWPRCAPKTARESQNHPRSREADPGSAILVTRPKRFSPRKACQASTSWVWGRLVPRKNTCQVATRPTQQTRPAGQPPKKTWLQIQTPMYTWLLTCGFFASASLDPASHVRPWGPAPRRCGTAAVPPGSLPKIVVSSHAMPRHVMPCHAVRLSSTSAAILSVLEHVTACCFPHTSLTHLTLCLRGHRSSSMGA